MVMTEHKNITGILTKYMSFKIHLMTATKEDNYTVPNIYPKKHICFDQFRITNSILAYGTRISTSTFGAGKCHLTPPCKTSRVR